MSGLELVGFVLVSGGTLLNTCKPLEALFPSSLQSLEAGQELRKLVSESKERVERIIVSVDRVPGNSIPVNVLENARVEFCKIQ